MKKIAITQRLILNDNYYELREALDTRWGLLFDALNFLPIILPIEYNFKKYFDSIKIDGILLTGGNDLNSLNCSDESLQRDIFEKELIKYGIKNNIPILGVCRGMQVIAEYFGASFIKVKDQVAIKHSLKVNEESKYFNELSKLNDVNSFHNYAVENLTKDLLISATDNNDTIKAIEHKEYKIFAQMWHSERDKIFDKEQLKLIEEFFT